MKLRDQVICEDKDMKTGTFVELCSPEVTSSHASTPFQLASRTAILLHLPGMKGSQTLVATRRCLSSMEASYYFDDTRRHVSGHVLRESWRVRFGMSHVGKQGELLSRTFPIEFSFRFPVVAGCC